MAKLPAANTEFSQLSKDLPTTKCYAFANLHVV